MQGQPLHEPKKIVKSLFATKVIHALSEKNAFVPYQDSVLAKMLRNSLGGNSLTMIVCTASPHGHRPDKRNSKHAKKRRLKGKADRKHRESKILEVYMKERNKTKHKCKREQYLSIVIVVDAGWNDL